MSDENKNEAPREPKAIPEENTLKPELSDKDLEKVSGGLSYQKIEINYIKQKPDGSNESV
jgi:bacteriocin-like protein